MACELSTIVTDIPANKYWIIDGENGLLFKPFDYEVLAKKLIFLLQNKQLQQLFGIRSRKIIIEKAEQNVQMANIERIYQKLSRNVCKT
jgi:glycosyltransferase involved in cell wall biosynthesis